jgi:ABC-type multidrug transport system fused ATPase/permease subunit
MQGSMSLGKLVAISFVFSQLASAAQRLSNFNLQYKSSLASLERIDELQQLPIEFSSSTEDGKLNIKYSIEFQNAEFSYPDGRQAIKGITFTAQPGETVALVGPNGSGKSTLIKLLLKLYEAQQGDIVIAGKSIKLWNPFHLRSLISYVPQENYLFPSNLEENIHLGKPGAPFEEVLTAARLAGVQDFISKLPQGYETLLSETAINLSGGERQRISLARAFLKNSPILILDEAVSQVDSQSEEIIRETMRHLSAGRTVIIIAHRLSTVLQSDKIVVLNEGKVEAVGKHGELYQNCQLYRQLCESQFLKLPERVNV